MWGMKGNGVTVRPEMLDPLHLSLPVVSPVPVPPSSSDDPAGLKWRKEALRSNSDAVRPEDVGQHTSPLGPY